MGRVDPPFPFFFLLSCRLPFSSPYTAPRGAPVLVGKEERKHLHAFFSFFLRLRATYGNMAERSAIFDLSFFFFFFLAFLFSRPVGVETRCRRR